MKSEAGDRSRWQKRLYINPSFIGDYSKKSLTTSENQRNRETH